MKRFIWQDMSAAKRNTALARPAGLSDNQLVQNVRTIMEEVKARGDAAVLDYTRKFDAPNIASLQVSKDAMKAAWDNLPTPDKAALKTAKANIEAFHSAQMPIKLTVETMPGVTCRREPRPLASAGLYVPGGTAPLVSTLLMLALPAKVAGVEQRIVVTPPGKDGSINAAILAAAWLCDVTALYACGGAQAIAALAYGTETIPRCDKIFGPGNAYVAMAKSLAAQEPGGPAIDLPAGPSEAMVIADETANPVFVASDLLSQAEHDELAQVVCVCTSVTLAQAIENEITAQVSTLPRHNIASAALNEARMIIATERETIVDIVNTYSPEHLIVQMKDPESLVPDIRCAGSVFLGPWTPESVGDYASGTNHTLPTNGAARAYSGLTLESFMTYMSVQSLTRAGLEALGPTVEKLATLEGLEAHRRAVSLRLESETV